MKKIICILLTLLLLPAGCAKSGAEKKVPWKIAIVTGSAAKGEAIHAAENLKKAHDYIITRTYPDDESAESTIKICTELAQDQSVRAIVFVNAVAGTHEAATKVKEMRPDILFLAGAEPEDAGYIAQTADIVLAQDLYTMGREVVNEAYRMGARKFIHYTFARHLLEEPVLRRREIMVERCVELGIEFIDITTPDPLSAEGGKEEARQFIEEDVPQKVGDYGQGTAFFATDCSIAAELIKRVLECGAIYPQPCCPSPFHGYTELFGIDNGAYDNPEEVLAEIADAIAPYGNTGRMATWPLSPEVLTVEAGVKYAMAYAEGEVKKETDREKLDAIFRELSGGRASLSSMAHAPNCLLFFVEYHML